jgi:hypothetical protein
MQPVPPRIPGHQNRSDDVTLVAASRSNTTKPSLTAYSYIQTLWEIGGAFLDDDHVRTMFVASQNCGELPALVESVFSADITRSAFLTTAGT